MLHSLMQFYLLYMKPYKANANNYWLCIVHILVMFITFIFSANIAFHYFDSNVLDSMLIFWVFCPKAEWAKFAIGHLCRFPWNTNEASGNQTGVMYVRAWEKKRCVREKQSGREWEREPGMMRMNKRQYI